MSQKQPKKRNGASSSKTSSKITDSRFANFETDPRFRLPSSKKTKTTIDKRFSRMLKDDDFTAIAKVDRYGRKVKTDTKKKALQRLYQEEDDDVEVEDDDIVRRELEKADAKYDPARGGGFSSSESESDSDEDDEESEAEKEQVDTAPDMQQFRAEQAEVPTGDITTRIAIVNLDWDHVKSVDLMALFSSFLPVGGRIEKVAVYPSEFGKERMQREELEGPPKEIFKKGAIIDDDEDQESEDESERDYDDEVDSDEEAKKELLEEGDDQDFDSDALRTYQLDRLRYYYAVMTCSDKNSAHKIYQATDGTEYQSSSNFLDLRFVPDDVTFDDEPRDECDAVPSGYKPVEFVTDALQHSKVKLTWDMHPEEAMRKESIKNAFSGSRADIAENDLRTYLASDSESEDDEDEAAEEQLKSEAGEEPKLSKKELARRKMRAALGLSEDPAPKSSKSAPIGGMQITFTPALTEDTSGKKKGDQEETTVEKYLRKERERRAKRKEKASRIDGDDVDAAGEDDQAATEDLGFDDPFFTAEEPSKPTKSALRKEERLKKREAKEEQEKQDAAEKAQLELLMADNANDDGAHLDHFDMNEIIRAEKQKGKKKKKKGKHAVEDRGGLQDDFQMDVGDSRFKAVFENHEFAIDPSNPKFKATHGMKKLLEEGRKKRKTADDEETVVRQEGTSKKAKRDDLGGLVASIKKKSSSRK